ncbi:MAG: MarR family transcriptional regulator [Phycisphaerae bacterium]|nr:MarR family transcriptional regulator [Phycisphaerae bacterium]
MKDLIAELERYLSETLGVAVAPEPWERDRRLPLFLQERYRFFQAQLLGRPCLLMTDKGIGQESPATIRKHIEQVQAKWDGLVVYVRERIEAYNRKRLIEQKVPFIVPGNQMYLPILGVDLREHFRKRRPERTTLRPSTQVVLIHTLLRGGERASPTALAPKLGYSVMTISRALDELEDAGLAESSPSGRERYLHLAEPKPDVWKKAQPFLRDPVTSRHAIKMARRRGLPGPRAGLSALARYSMLAEPRNVVVALSRENWKSLRQQDAVTEAAMDEPNGLNVEVWSYAPTLFAGNGSVDRVSLYLSLRETNDERIESALDQMMRDVEW